MHPSVKGGKAEKYENWNKSELYKRAQTLKIKGRSKMDKAQLITALHSN